jgi:[FeFe] hydrogenase H-cluster maturation GTPase HydF
MTKGREAKPHIGILGRRNSGKSSIINALTGQDVAIVSEIAGTTTDPVKKSLEIERIGPVVLIDTAGIDDVGELGEKRVEKTMHAIVSLDAAILVISGNTFGKEERIIIEKLDMYEIPYLVVHNKSDIGKLSDRILNQIKLETNKTALEVSAWNKDGIELLIQSLKTIIPDTVYQSKSLLGSLLKHGDLVLLITPIDIEAPEGRLILPQIQAIRDILDNDCVAIVAKEREIDTLIKKIQLKPVLAITDSQVFPKADASVPKEIPLTSFSIMLAYHKGDFANYLKGTPKISELKDNDRVLILESCSHHVSCDDIGRVKIPRWLTNFTGKKLEFDVVAGLNKLPRDIHDYAMVIQCGGCMITRKQVINRLKPAIEAGIPVTNYGMAIAYVHGIYKRAIAPFAKTDLQDNYL